MLIFVLIEGRERRLYRIAHPLASSFIFLLFCLPLNRTLAYRLSFPLSLYTIFHQLIQTLSNDTCHHLVIFIIWPIQHTVSFMDDLFDIPYCFVLLLYEFMRLVQCFLDASVHEALTHEVLPEVVHSRLARLPGKVVTHPPLHLLDFPLQYLLDVVVHFRSIFQLFPFPSRSARNG